ncbi:MAG: GNAT family N-acetyltransferase [Paracoccaceae bacterium]
MSLTFRGATPGDVAAVVALLRDDALGVARETAPDASYIAAFDAMRAEAANHLIVGDLNGRIVATYQITFISGLSLRATRRAQIESVRVASDLRGQRIGEALFADAEARARTAGCGLIQLTTNASRDRARTFYERLGFTPSHIGYKRDLGQ